MEDNQSGHDRRRKRVAPASGWPLPANLTALSPPQWHSTDRSWRHRQVRADALQALESRIHQACTRMLRADYCGDGTPHTQDGTEVDVYDTLGIQSPQADSDMTFEAAWTADGSACVRKVRNPEITTLDALLESCPARLRGHTGTACSEQDMMQSGEPLVLNRSRSL